MEKSKKTASDVREIIVDGVAYIKQVDALKMTGTKLSTFKNKVDRFGIKKYKVNGLGREMFRKDELVDAIERGLFIKYL